MNDKDRPIDERIAAAAREHYNAPPATPADDMWAKIASRPPVDEQAGPAGADVTPLRPAGAPIRTRSPRTLPGGLGWWVGIAAALLIGLGLGRLSLGGGDPAPVVAERAAPAGTTFAGATDEVPGEVPDGALDVAPGEAPGASAADARPVRERTLAAAPRGREPVDEAATTPGAPSESDGAVAMSPARPAPTTALPYRVATLQHLDRSESFLAMARSGLEEAEDDPGFGTWARSLLSRTQLLLASPAVREPATRRLLQDLELMLAQIVVSIETGDPAEARITGEGLQESDLLLRLRSATTGTTKSPAAGRPPRSSSL